MYAGRLIFAGLLLLLLVTEVYARNTVRILVIHAYSQEYPWTKGQHQGFVDTLQQGLGHSAVLHTEYLDTKRLSYGAEYAEWFADYIDKKYKAANPKAIYVTDDNGLSFGLDHLSRIFPNAPLFFSGVNNFSVREQLDPERQTGIFEKKEPAPNLEAMRQLFGKVEQINVVGDDSNTYRAIARELHRELDAKQDFQVNYIAHNRIDKITAELRASGGAPVLLTTVGAMRNSRDEAMQLQEIIERITAAGSGAVISMEDAYLFDGVLGGFVTSGPAQGRAAADLLLSYLSGRRISELPPLLRSPNEYVFNDRVLQSLALELPLELAVKSKLLYPRSGIFERYRYLVVGLLVVLATAFIATLVLYTVHVTRGNRKLREQSQLLLEQGKRLEESEEKYRLLFERSEDPMLVIKGDQFTISNQAACRILGYDSLNSLQHVHPFNISPELQPDGLTSLAKGSAMMEEAYRKGYHRFEWIHQKKDGVPIPIEVSLTRIPFEGENALFCVWRDMTEQRRAQRALQEKTIYLNSVLRASVNVGIIATDPALNISYYNETVSSIFGLQPGELDGKDIHVFHGGGNDGPSRRIEMALQQARKDGEYRFSLERDQQDEKRYIDARISPITTEDGALSGYMLMAEDVTSQHKAEETIKFQAAYDALTALPNRRSLLERLAQDLSNCQRHGHFGALLFLDLDNFKHVNDSMGHPVGDALLKEVADRMRHAVRSEDTVARLGGDEFVVLLAEVGDSLEQALLDVQAIAEKLLQAISRPVTLEGHELHPRTSIGITLFPSQDKSPDDILRKADTALYQAKEAGRNTFKFFSSNMQKRVEQRMQLLTGLTQAMDRGEFEVHFQPQIDDADKLIGVESLVRWQRPGTGTVYPDDFIPLAEESGLIRPISEFVMRESLMAQLRWREYSPDQPPPLVAINISATQFDQNNFADNIVRILEQTDADASHLTLELTESMLLGDIETTIGKMRRLKELGIRFSIDDFGTGYSSLAYLKRLPIDEIKIDRSFIQDVPGNANDSAVVETILTLAKQLRLEVVAEGVENREALDFLKSRGCRIFQGYYFSKPVTAATLEQRFLTGHKG